MNLPAFFVTTIHLSIPDRLRVLWHGGLIYRAEIEPDPGDFEIVNVVVKIPRIRKDRAPSVGYEIEYPQRPRAGETMSDKIERDVVVEDVLVFPFSMTNEEIAVMSSMSDRLRGHFATLEARLSKMEEALEEIAVNAVTLDIRQLAKEALAGERR